ncbi:uncharacterized protein F4807DRAFT_460252 [Annulohypoxylon truncatum]|uniref:uncharacterized protein n=1 Tax=Annulohypoxylon truncatum TaxID=327061 RepID=UPI0020087F01|nr:uncharacterized protein F4807DRAFT_460252 [Annulohypoxylon truncatum]KAI1209962.1 hypothetical protein F4807DRAFT_460252 [Annulohypoxylon truncatum]
MKVLATALLLLPWAIDGKVSPYVLEDGVAYWDATGNETSKTFCLPYQNNCDVKYTYQLDLNHCFINTGGFIYPDKEGKFGCRNCKDGAAWGSFECDCDIWASGTRKSVGFLDSRASAMSPIEWGYDNKSHAMVPKCFDQFATLDDVADDMNGDGIVYFGIVQ